MSLFKRLLKTTKQSASKKKVDHGKYYPEEKLPIDEKFTYNFNKNGGKFLYCENEDELRSLQVDARDQISAKIGNDMLYGVSEGAQQYMAPSPLFASGNTLEEQKFVIDELGNNIGQMRVNYAEGVEDYNKNAVPLINQIKSIDRIYTISDDMENDDIIIEFDINECTPERIMNFISKIQYIIENTSEIGMYEHDIFKIKINKHIDRASEKIQISNPIIKEADLYTIL